MNSLEFINEEIEKLKTILELDDVLCELSDNDHKFYNDKLQTLQQIKNELEAWEVVKPNIKYEEAENNEGIYMQYFLFLEVEEWKPEAFKIKKALEVKNDK